jgi:MinD superfamily P-loop ATPase
MPNDNALFQQCINQAESIPDVIKSVISVSSSYKKRRSTRLLQKFEQHTQLLQNASDIVDIVVQTQAGIGCPIWAPIKFVLKV